MTGFSCLKSTLLIALACSFFGSPAKAVQLSQEQIAEIARAPLRAEVFSANDVVVFRIQNWQKSTQHDISIARSKLISLHPNLRFLQAGAELIGEAGGATVGGAAIALAAAPTGAVVGVIWGIGGALATTTIVVPTAAVVGSHIKSIRRSAINPRWVEQRAEIEKEILSIAEGKSSQLTLTFDNERSLLDYEAQIIDLAHDLN